MNRETHIHPFDPVCDALCRVLVLGTFPSVKSRENAFYYGHPQNRFWRVVSAVFEEPLPQSIPQKRAMLLRHHIALWDVIASCDIAGSSDASSRNAVPNDLPALLRSVPALHQPGQRCLWLGCADYSLEESPDRRGHGTVIIR